jgi:hypothetical protein
MRRAKFWIARPIAARRQDDRMAMYRLEPHPMFAWESSSVHSKGI